MRRILGFVLVFGLATFVLSTKVQAQVIEATINDEGNIVISGSQELIGIELNSPGGFLIPSSNPAPEPFDFVVANSTREIVFGSLGTDNVFDLDGSLVLDARYSSPGAFDLVGTWGGPLQDQLGPITFVVPTPEPNGYCLAVFGAMVLLIGRKRRRH